MSMNHTQLKDHLTKKINDAHNDAQNRGTRRRNTILDEIRLKSDEAKKHITDTFSWLDGELRKHDASTDKVVTEIRKSRFTPVITTVIVLGSFLLGAWLF